MIGLVLPHGAAVNLIERRLLDVLLAAGGVLYINNGTNLFAIAPK